MNERCEKFWADSQFFMAQAQGKKSPDRQVIHSKIMKDLHVMSRFLQRNQTARFSEGAQQKLVDTIAVYNAYEKQLRKSDLPESGRLLGDLQRVIKDALAMPFTVLSSKHKKKLLKWHNESTIDSVEDTTSISKRAKWTVLDVDDDGFLTLMSEESGDIVENFSVSNKSEQFQKIREGLDRGSVSIFTVNASLLSQVEVEDE